MHRFYCEARYSDDLDLFMQGQPFFYEEVKELLYRLEQKFEIKTIVNARDFLRLKIDNLQVDFVNDRVYRYGKSNIINGIKVDNVFNILANKLTAILSRDEEKDVFDIVNISLAYDFYWTDILDAAHKKEVFEDYSLLERLKTFPLNWFEKLKLIKKLIITDDVIESLCEDIKHKNKNSLFKMDIPAHFESSEYP